MSYFPCDIPFMSDDELKENGIHIPKEKITNREKLAKMSTQEIVEYLCVVFTGSCSECIGHDMCEPNGGKANGLVKWLESEAEEDNG